MRIHYFGNTNNIYYRLAKRLRSEGIDAHLFLYKNDYFANDPSKEDPDVVAADPGWIHWLPRTRRFDLVGMETIRSCQTADVVQLSGARAVSGLLSGKPYIFNPTGGDLFAAALWPWRQLQPLGQKILGSTVNLPKVRTVRTWLQRLGIRRATAIQVSYASYVYDHAFAHLRTPALRFHIPPLITGPRHVPSPGELAPNHWSLDDPGTLTILHPTRQNWQLDDARSGTHKGNDRLYKAVAKARDRGLKVHVFIVEYQTNSPDLEASKQLTRQLGISEAITWLPQMPVRELYSWYAAVDVVADQFSNGGLGFVCLEAMSCGTPVLIRTHPGNTELFGEPPPTIDVASESDIVCALLKYGSKRELLFEKAKECRRWTSNFLRSESLIQRYIRMYETVIRCQGRR